MEKRLKECSKRYRYSPFYGCRLIKKFERTYIKKIMTALLLHMMACECFVGINNDDLIRCNNVRPRDRDWSGITQLLRGE